MASQGQCKAGSAWAVARGGFGRCGGGRPDRAQHEGILRLELLVRRTDIHHHDNPHRTVHPVGDGIVANHFDLALAKRGVRVRKIADGTGMLPQAVNEIHDLPALEPALWDGFQETKVQENLMRSHAGLPLVEFPLELLRRQPVRALRIG